MSEVNMELVAKTYGELDKKKRRADDLLQEYHAADTQLGLMENELDRMSREMEGLIGTLPENFRNIPGIPTPDKYRVKRAKSAIQDSAAPQAEATKPTVAQTVETPVSSVKKELTDEIVYGSFARPTVSKHARAAAASVYGLGGDGKLVQLWAGALAKLSNKDYKGKDRLVAIRSSDDDYREKASFVGADWEIINSGDTIYCHPEVLEKYEQQRVEKQTAEAEKAMKQAAQEPAEKPMKVVVKPFPYIQVISNNVNEHMGERQEIVREQLNILCDEWRREHAAYALDLVGLDKQYVGEMAAHLKVLDPMDAQGAVKEALTIAVRARFKKGMENVEDWIPHVSVKNVADHFKVETSTAHVLTGLLAIKLADKKKKVVT